MNPELSFQEFNTQKFVEEKLKEYGLSNLVRMANTGVIAIVEGKNPSKKSIALRADMDALPIQETNKTDYVSSNPGVMHACGHDVHTSSLLGVARIMNELKNEFDTIGDVRGVGLLLAIEIVDSKKTKIPDMEIAKKIYNVCVEEGLLLHLNGRGDTVNLGLTPPLIITKEQVDKAVSIFRKAFKLAK